MSNIRAIILGKLLVLIGEYGTSHVGEVCGESALSCLSLEPNRALDPFLGTRGPKLYSSPVQPSKPLNFPKTLHVSCFGGVPKQTVVSLRTAEAPVAAPPVRASDFQDQNLSREATLCSPLGLKA